MAGIVFLGPPGSGKGTQAQILAQSLAIPHISTGEILREAISHETELGKQAKAYVDGGELVPDELLLDLIRERLSQPDAQTGWILDGFPRTIAQAAFLDELLAELGQLVPSAIDLKVPPAVLIQRLMLRGRKDDTEETVRRRLEIYEENTAPLIEYYQQREKILSIDGDLTPEEVAESLRVAVNL